jgi:hypothetical protein
MDFQNNLIFKSKLWPKIKDVTLDIIGMSMFAVNETKPFE